MSDFATSLSPDALAAVQGWLTSLKSERRMSGKTLEAYARDMGQFAQFMGEHLGGAPGNRELAELTVSDFRAFLARRRNQSVGHPHLQLRIGRTEICPVGLARLHI